jgi:hypothetical protein
MVATRTAHRCYGAQAGKEGRMAGATIWWARLELQEVIVYRKVAKPFVADEMRRRDCFKERGAGVEGTPRHAA